MEWQVQILRVGKPVEIIKKSNYLMMERLINRITNDDREKREIKQMIITKKG